jgi:hypothetical protein
VADDVSPEGAKESLEEILRVVFHAVALQQRDQFVLERPLAMVLSWSRV